MFHAMDLDPLDPSDPFHFDLRDFDSLDFDPLKPLSPLPLTEEWLKTLVPKGLNVADKRDLFRLQIPQLEYEGSDFVLGLGSPWTQASYGPAT